MKKIMMMMMVISFFAFSAENSFAEIAGSVMGGFRSAEATGPHTVKIKCAEVMKKKCYTVKSNGDIVIGDPVPVFVHTDPNDENIGQGYVNTIFMGYETPGIPESGIEFETTSETIEFDNYFDWDNYSSGTN